MKAYKQLELLQNNVRQLQLYLQSCTTVELCNIMLDNNIPKTCKYDNRIALAQDITQSLWSELLDIQIYMIDKNLQHSEGEMYIPDSLLELILDTGLILPQPIIERMRQVDYIKT